MPGFDVWEAQPAQAALLAEINDRQQEAGYEYEKILAETVAGQRFGLPMPDWLTPELVGFNVVRLSQSFVESWRKCPSSAVAEKRATYGEAAAKGIVAHSIVDGRIAHQGIFPEVDQQFYDLKFNELAAGVDSEPFIPPDVVEFERIARAYADVLTEVYMEKYHPYVLSGAATLETEAKGQLLWDLREDPSTDVDFILMTGSADLVITNGIHRIGVDWKTGAKMPEPWMIQRYSVQWRAYAVMFNLSEMHFEYPLAMNPLNGNKGDWVANRYKGVASVYADQHERAAYNRQLRAELTPIASALLRSQAPEDHVIRPTDWHCSAKWCQRFAAGDCIGQDNDVAWIAKSHLEAATAVGAIQTTRKTPTTEGTPQ